MSDIMDDDDMPPHVRKLVQDAAARDTSAYKVGFGKPPIEHRFQKGQRSANPRGRPRKSKAFQQDVLDEVNRKLSFLHGGKPRRKTVTQVSLQQLGNKAAAGDLKAIRELIRLQEKVSPLRPEASPINEEELAKRRALSAHLIELLDAKASDSKPERPRPPKPTD